MQCFWLYLNKNTLLWEAFSYVLIDEFILVHAGSEKLLLHLQYGCLLSAQPLLLGVLDIYKQRERISLLLQLFKERLN